MIPDAMYPLTGVFFGTHRELMAEVYTISIMASWGYLPTWNAGPGPGSSAGGPMRRRDGTSALLSAPQGSSRPAQNNGSRPLRLTQNSRPDYSRVGSFSASVREDASTVVVAGSTYSKAPILARLELPEESICLPSFLCNKGAAGCLQAGRPGHERHDSALHTFSSAALALRPSFEEPPFRLVSTELVLHRPPNPSRGGAAFGRRGGGRFGGNGTNCQ